MSVVTCSSLVRAVLQGGLESIQTFAAFSPFNLDLIFLCRHQMRSLIPVEVGLIS